MNYNRNIFLLSFIILSILIINSSYTSAYGVGNILQYYSFDTGTINAFTDDTGNGNYLTTSTNSSTIVTGKVNNAVKFNVTGATYESLTNIGTSSFSINYWFKSNSTTSSDRFYLKNTTGTSSGTYYIARIGGTFTFKNNFGDILSILTLPDDNKWYMITIVYNDSNTMIYGYVNGTLKANITFDLGTYNISRFSLLDYYNSYDELMFLNIAITQTDITNLYDNTTGLNYTEIIQSINYTIPPANISINYSANYTKIGNNYFSTLQCINIVPGLDYICNDSFYNPIDNGFYCNLDNAIYCGIGYDCITNIYDANTTELFLNSQLKTCTQLQNNKTTISIKCSPQYSSTSNTWWPNNPLYTMLETAFGYGCTTYDTYIVSTSTYCSDLDIWDWTAQRENDTFYTEGQCITTGCSNTCTPNTYKCNSITQSAKCVIQTSGTFAGCYDWNISENCRSGDICRDAYGYCSPIILNNTCIDDSDCPIGAYCNSIGECQTGTNPNPSDITSFFGGDGLSTGAKLIIPLIIIAITIIVFTFIGGSSGAMSVGLIAGIILGVFELIIFTVLGWIPVWIIIVLTLISILVISISIFRGGNSGGA